MFHWDCGHKGEDFESDGFTFDHYGDDYKMSQKKQIIDAINYGTLFDHIAPWLDVSN